MSIKILGTGAYVPEKIVTNDDLSKMVDTSDEWIMQRVGVKKRHISVDETAADLITDGCNMGIKSLYKYMNQYPNADEKVKELCTRLISIEDQLRKELRSYL